MRCFSLSIAFCLVIAASLAACTSEDASGGSPAAARTSGSTVSGASATPTPDPTPAPDPATLRALSITPTSITLSSNPNDPPGARQATFTAIGTFSDGQATTSAVWTANPSGLLTLSQGGVATVLPAAPAGTVTLTASSGSISATAVVHVVAAAVSVQAVQLSPADLLLFAPAPDQNNTAGFPTTAPLSPTVQLSDGSTETAVTWSVTPPGVATVSLTGVVTALQKGTATLAARAIKDPSKLAQCSLTVQAKSKVEVIVQ